MNKNKIIAVLVVLVVIMGIGLYKSGSGKVMDKAADTKLTPEVASVAKVNGVALSQAIFETQLAAAVASYKGQGINVEDPAKLGQIKTQVLNNLINNELVAQGASKSGVAVTGAEVEKQFQDLVAQTGGIDKFKVQLAAAKLTEDQLRGNIARQLVIQKYLQGNINTKSITVSDAEIAKFYADNSKGQKNVPALKTISPQIKQQLLLDKQQSLVNAFVTSLREGAKIETSI